MKLNKKIMIPLTIIICLLIVYISTMIGNTSVSFVEANKILLNKLFGFTFGGTVDGTSGEAAIIWNIRLPRILLCFITGGALALCGSAFQGIFKNPMADPYILGVSSGAALGAAIGIVLNLNSGLIGMSSVTLLAFAGALLTIFVVYSISRVGRRVPVTNLLLSGVALSQTLSAFMSLVMIFNSENMTQIMFWTMGSLNGSDWTQILIVLPFVVFGGILLLTTSRELDIMLLGEDTAMQLGVDVEKLKRKVLISASLIVAAVVSVTGIIGFVGLVVPHVVRIIAGPKHRVLMPVSIIVGGAFLIICDTLARSVMASEIPVGIITAAFGGPFFIYLLRKNRKTG